MKLKIERINHYEKNSQGVPYTGKFGPYSLCRILTTIEGEKRTISGIDDKGGVSKSWKDGEEIDVEITPKVVGDKTYYNFKIPDQKVTRQEFDELKKKVQFLDDEVLSLHKKFEAMGKDKGPQEVETTDEFNFDNEPEGMDLGESPIDGDPNEAF